MSLPIRGFIESSLIEWEGVISSVIILQGCNLACPFCHSHGLISCSPLADPIALDGILSYLEERQGWVDGVVISGGEPTIQQELPEMLEELKALDLKIKIDTNGTSPQMLSRLIENQLVDYVAMDFKAPFETERYSRATGNKADLPLVRSSARLLLDGKVNYEFRTTVCPPLVTLEDLPIMAQSIAGARLYVLQQFVPETALDPEMRSSSSYSKEQLISAASAIEGTVQTCRVRGESNAPKASATISSAGASTSVGVN